MFAATILFGVGCNREPPLPKTHAVNGAVVYKNGAPMKGGSITFSSAEDPMLRVLSEIGPDGGFSLRTAKNNQSADGAPEGEYQVTVQPPPIAVKEGGQGKPVEPILLAQKYRVEAKDNTIKIELPKAAP
ncbi:MAG: hypothetical protein HYR84_17090 [Planctomycetes bacterium]|nr:hypothetical protein [Planctomycetota bacterium]